jgi:hypothetical protein
MSETPRPATAVDDGRQTANPTGRFVLFLIGMRVNSWWRPDLWIPIFRSMRRMQVELRRRPELGLLGGMMTGFSNPAVLIQYWKSVEHLQAFASGKELQHVPAWNDFNRRVRATRAVGVWHETYLIEPGQHESVYVGMPPFGLGAVFGVRPATGPLATARGRLSQGKVEDGPAHGSQRH